MISKLLVFPQTALPCEPRSKVVFSSPSQFIMRLAIICAVWISLLAGVLMSRPAEAVTGKLVSEKSGRCLDVPRGDATPRTPVEIYDCNGGANQTWELTAASELRTLGGTRCLDVRGASTQPQAIVQSTTCNGGNNQKWTLKADGTIVGVQSGLCLTVVGGGTANQSGIDTWPCSNVAHQRWSGLAAPDTEAPTPPTGLSISGLSCRAVTLSWQASTDNVGVASYDIYHDGQSLGTVNGNTLSSLLTLIPGANWGLYVNARDAAGNLSKSSASLPIAVPQCQSDTQPPTTPTGLKGAAAGTTVNLSWNAATDNIGVIAYDIFRNNSKVGSTAALNYADAGLAANTSFQYSVQARDAQNNVSASTPIVVVTTGTSCANAVCSVTEVTTDTDIPWGVAVLPDGDILYSQRDTHDIIRLNPVTGAKTNVGKVPNVSGTDGEGGLLGIAITPDFPSPDQWLYIYHTTASDNRIVRIKYQGGLLVNSTLQVLLSGINRSKFHNGGRLRFGPDGKLYASVGDAESKANAQDKNSLSGKILRLNPDGTRPADNPFNNYVWSYGHRNPQGLAFDSQGRLWEQEFGDTQDETNLIVKGGNYGWPDCEGTISRAGSGCATAGYIAPKYTYANSTGSCSGIAIVRDALYVACLFGKRMYRHEISGTSLTNVQQYFVGTYDRLRTVEPSLDGGLWMTNSDAKGDKDSIPNNTNTKVFKVILGN
jgi:glucose/arabinose dehydrogenase